MKNCAGAKAPFTSGPVQPGTCFTFQPGHIFYTFGPNLMLVSGRRRAVGMCESGFWDLHISIA